MMKEMKLVFASNNAHKLAEVREIMPVGIEVLSLREIGFEHEIDETGTTLEENSRIKADAVCQYLRDRKIEISGVFADDTGLEIDALDGRPGVYTARWYRMGESHTVPQLTDERAVFTANRAKALRELAGKTNRGAQFRTVITLIKLSEVSDQLSEVSDQLSEIQVEGIVRGRIATEEYGEGGFGYDPIFIPDGYDKTFGELPAEIKNTISHRARALENLVKELEK